MIRLRGSMMKTKQAQMLSKKKTEALEPFDGDMPLPILSQ